MPSKTFAPKSGMDEFIVSTLVRDFTAAGHIGTMGVNRTIGHRSFGATDDEHIGTRG